MRSNTQTAAAASALVWAVAAAALALSGFTATASAVVMDYPAPSAAAVLDYNQSGGNGSAVPNATSAHVSALAQAPHDAEPRQPLGRPHPRARAFAVLGVVFIFVLLAIVRSLAYRHYEVAVQAQIAANTETLQASPTGSTSSSLNSDWAAPKHRYERTPC